MTDIPLMLWSPGAREAWVWLVDERVRAHLDSMSRLDGPLDATWTEGLERRPMAKNGDQFTIALPGGTDYLVSIDDGQPFPDPRSAWQPWGVHGPSRVFDTHAYQWQTEPGSREVLGEVFYELHVGTFTDEGTLDAAIEQLDHLVDLGVRTVELMPLAAFPGRQGWGYDGVALFAVHQPYGGPAALQRFVDAAHAKGLAVCLDVVYNHFGPAGNYTGVFAPYMTDRHQTPWGAAVNLDDEHCEGVRQFIIDNACRWLRDFRMDALRLDAVHALVDDSPTHLLAELSAAVDELEAQTGRRLTLIAESEDNQIATTTPLAEGGLGMDAQWDDDVHHALHSYLTEETFGYYVDFGSADVLAKALQHVFVHDGTYSTFRKAMWGTPIPDDIPRERFVIFTHNHDQVGNRGKGDRPDVGLDDGALAGAAALLLMSPYTPMIFQGQEWASTAPFQFFTDHDADLGRLVTEGRLQEFAGHGWEEIYGPNPTIPDPQAESTFQASKVAWDELHSTSHATMLEWYRSLIRLRASHRSSWSGKLTTSHGDDWFAMSYGGFTTIICPGPYATDLPRELTHVDGLPRPVRATWGRFTIEESMRLGAHSVVILD